MSSGVKLADYITYLSNEVINARKQADLASVQMAQEYAAHDYLKYFKAPRFTMPAVKLEIPLRISELYKDTHVEYTPDEAKLKRAFNKELVKIEKQHSIDLSHFKTVVVKPGTFDHVVIAQPLRPGVITSFDTDDKNIITVDDLEDALDRKKITALFDKKFTQQLKKAKIKKGSIQYNQLLLAFEKAYRSQFKVVNKSLNDIYIDPNARNGSTMEDTRIPVHMEIELTEENIKIVRHIDENGKTVETVILE